MKKLLLLLTIISHFALGQNASSKYDASAKKSYLQTGVAPKANVVEYTDTASGISPIWKFNTGRVKFKNLATTTDTATYNKVLVLSGDSLRQMSRTYFGGGGSATIDTTKVGRIEQGRGTTQGSMYFNGVAWVKNDTSYIPKSGTNRLTGDLLRTGDGETYVGVRNGGNTATNDYYVDGGIRILESVAVTGGNSYSGTFATSGTDVATWSAGVQGTFGDKRFTFTLNQPYTFEGSKLMGDSVYRTNDSLRYIQLKDAQERFAPIGGGGGSVTSVFGRTGAVTAQTGDYTVSQVTNAQTTALTSGYINIGDGTNTAFPRALSGDATISNLGSLLFSTVNSNVGTFGSATQTPVLVTNAKGLITSISNATVTPSVGSITGLGTNVATALGNTLGSSGGIIGNSSSNTLVGSLQFSGTTNSGLSLNNLTSTQIAALTPSVGMIEANTTTNVPVYYDGTNFVALKDNTVFNVKDWGAKGDGTTDDKSAIDACIASAPSDAIVYFPLGNYIVSSELATITKKLRLLGAGRTASKITINSTTSNVIVFDGGSSSNILFNVAVEDIQIINTSVSAKTGGSAIRFNYCGYSRIDDVIINGFFNNIFFNNTYTIGSTNVLTQNFTNSGFKILNNDAGMVDYGDSYITNSTIVSSALVVSNYGIYQENSGGTRITSCKFIRGSASFAFNYPYYYLGSATTVKLMITGNSFDTFNRNAIYISKGTGLFSDVTITGNTIENGDVSYSTMYFNGIYAASISGNTLTGQVTNYAIELNDCNDININNSYRNYNLPILQTGTNTNINGQINTNFRAPNTPINGGQVSFLSAQITTSSQLQLGVNFGAYYSGTSAVSSGRNAVLLDNITSQVRWGVDQNGTMWVGASNASYGLYCTQAGVVSITGSLAVGTGTAATTAKLVLSAGSASVAGMQLTNQTAYTSAVVGSISLENTNDISHVGNIVTKRGATTNIGTYDSQILQLVTGNANRVSIGTTGIVTLTASLVGIASQDVFNTVSTTVNAFGAATSLTLGGTSTATITYGIGTNATATTTTKTINIGTGGASGSITNINLGAATSGATSNITVNGALKLPIYTVATLPTAVAGTIVYVSDALTPIYNSTVTGGGAEGITVVYNGTTWTCH